ncbi:MAG: penicillin-binding transpeptidase domain-containing protein [Christensenellales bacterium]
MDGAILTPSDAVGKELEGESAYYTPPGIGTQRGDYDRFQDSSAWWRMLDLVMQGHSPKGARCIVVNPQTGEVLAMSSTKRRPKQSAAGQYRRAYGKHENMLITDVYEAGSTFKVLTAAAMLESMRGEIPKRIRRLTFSQQRKFPYR